MASYTWIIKLKNCWQAAKDLLTEYSKHSTIHGVRYITETNRSWFERIWWILVVFASIVVCGKLIYEAWFINPIIISITEKPTSVWQIPFPAVTICPLIYSQSKHFHLKTTYQSMFTGGIHPDNMTEDVKLKLLAINMFCAKEIIYGTYEDRKHCNECLELLRKIRIPPEELFFECKFQNQVINCTEAFQEIVTNFGLCYTFNGFGIYHNQKMKRTDNQHWNIDEGYKATDLLNTYPRRVLGAGRKYSLSLLLRIRKDDIDDVCHPAPGFEIDFRMNHETPGVNSQVRLMDSATFVLKPRIMKIAEELKSYSVTERQCYLANERRMKYFQHYTTTNCRTECVVDMVSEKCGCHPIYIESASKVDTCGPRRFHCFSKCIHVLFQEDYARCGCLPACSSIIFESENLVTDLNLTALQRVSNTHQDFQYTHLKFYFKENQFMTSQRSELYGRTDFLADCGGLMGLSLGVSVISLFEIAYFFTIQLCFNLRQQKPVTQGASTTVSASSNSSFRLTRLFKVTKDSAADYADKTTIQGIDYMADDKLSRSERLWWAIIFVISVYCCASLVRNELWKFESSPVIISYENEETSVDKIPFPAVTICPQFVSAFTRHMYHLLIVEKVKLYALFQNE